MCARLDKSYGRLDVASIWQETYSKALIDLGIQQSAAWPALFIHCPEKGLRFIVHDDDFIAVGDDDVLKVLSKHFEFRMDGKIGPDALDGTAMIVLNRVLEYDSSGVLSYEADPRHAEYIVKNLGLEGCKMV